MQVSKSNGLKIRSMHMGYWYDNKYREIHKIENDYKCNPKNEWMAIGWNTNFNKICKWDVKFRNVIYKLKLNTGIFETGYSKIATEQVAQLDEYVKLDIKMDTCDSTFIIKTKHCKKKKNIFVPKVLNFIVIYFLIHNCIAQRDIPFQNIYCLFAGYCCPTIYPSLPATNKPCIISWDENFCSLLA